MYLSIRHRLSLPVLAGILIIFTALGLLYYFQVSQTTAAETVSTLEYRISLVRAGLAAARESARGLALSAAENTSIGAALAQGQRDNLLDLTYPLLVNAGRELGLSRFEFFKFPAADFLKVHAPSETRGDISASRPEVREVISKNTSRSGLAREDSKLVLRALEPIVHNGITVGAVEFGVSVDKQLLSRYVTFEHAFNISILLPDGKNGFSFAARNHNLPLIKANFPILAQVLADGRTRTFLASRNGQTSRVMVSALKGLDGSNLALAAIPLDLSVAEQALTRSLWILVAFGLISFLLIAGLIYWSSGVMLKHLRSLIMIMSQVAQSHDLTQRVELNLDQGFWEAKRRDNAQCDCFEDPDAQECWVSAGSFSPSPTCTSFTKGKLDGCTSCTYYRKSVAHEVQLAASIFNNLLASFSELVTDSQHHARRVAKIADALYVGAGQLNDQTQSQAAAVEEIAAGMEQMSASVGTNVDGAKKAETAGSQGHRLALQGAGAMESAMAATKAVTARSKDITAIVETVKEIAFRTNLLALNASVEAARAGEAGRGFAVVAAEVRSLAQQAQESAVRIKKLLSELVTRIHDSDERIIEAGQLLEVIVKGAANSAEQSAAISLSSQEQARAIETLNRVAMEIDRAAQGNASLVEQAGQAAATLADSAHLVMESVGRFITDGEFYSDRKNKTGSGALLIGPDGVEKEAGPPQLPNRR